MTRHIRRPLGWSHMGIIAAVADFADYPSDSVSVTFQLLTMAKTAHGRLFGCLLRPCVTLWLVFGVIRPTCTDLVRRLRRYRTKMPFRYHQPLSKDLDSCQLPKNAPFNCRNYYSDYTFNIKFQPGDYSLPRIVQSPWYKRGLTRRIPHGQT
jgi:hypothetical protein